MRGDLRDQLIGLLLALVASLGLVACGGENKDDVIAEGDEICREANDRLEELEEPESVSGLPDYARDARPIVDDAIDDLKALDAPDEDKESFDEFIAQSEELVRVLRDLEDSDFGTSDEELEQQNEEISQITEASNAAAEEYGFRDCAEE